MTLLTEDQFVDWLKVHMDCPKDLCHVGLGDDMAEIRWPEKASVCITTDLLLEGVHFDLQQATLKQVGYKAMAVNLSDCAAMATIPMAAVVSLGLPPYVSSEKLQELHLGLEEAAKRYHCPIVGGDTTRWRRKGALTVNVAMISRPGPTPPLKRSTAKIGDTLAVTGSLGGSLLGSHLTFTPRLAEAQTLAQTGHIHALMDLSDGLSTDVTRLCRASGVGALVEARHIPLSQSAQTLKDPLYAALNDGEDFELLFSLPAKTFKALKATWSHTTPITAIGTITEGDQIQIKMPNESTIPLLPKGYDHLTKDSL